jgi:hypothetical protein
VETGEGRTPPETRYIVEFLTKQFKQVPIPNYVTM